MTVNRAGVLRTLGALAGGLATMVSMDESGAELAARAVVAWLSFRDDVLPEIRRQFSQHVASAKNVAGITVE